MPNELVTTTPKVPQTVSRRQRGRGVNGPLKRIEIIVPEYLYEILKKEARLEQRSLAGQAVNMLESALSI